VTKRTGKTKGGSVSRSHFVLSGAIRDLEVEIRSLNKQKGASKRSLKSVTSAVSVDRRRERELQQQIAKLIEKGARFNEKRKKLQVKIDKLSDKIGKISKIKSEMSDI